MYSQKTCILVNLAVKSLFAHFPQNQEAGSLNEGIGRSVFLAMETADNDVALFVVNI